LLRAGAPEFRASMRLILRNNDNSVVAAGVAFSYSGLRGV
jgi:hypothetical protein